MTYRPPAVQYLLLAALILAIAGDMLLRVEPWGLNVPILTLLLFAGIGTLSHLLHDPLPIEAWLIAGLGLLTGICFSWRDAPNLMGFNFLAVIASIHLVTARKHARELPHMTFLDHLFHVFAQVVHLSVGPIFLLLRDLRAGTTEGAQRRSRGRQVWIGIALTVPALLLFGSLLTSADATFEYLITDFFRIDVWTIVGHAALIAFLSWIGGGWLRGRFLATETASLPVIFPKKLSLGVTELAILLGSLDLLFGLFVALQIPHFFGGHEAILGTPSLTYASYARRGFFELIAVAALGLPLLLFADWLFHGENAREQRLVRALSGIMIALLGVMLASAMHRLSLYMEAYGLTAARVNAAAILIWITLALVLFCVTVFRGKRQMLPSAIVVSGYMVLLGLNAVNPDALVARVNMARMSADGTFDPKYTFRLGADAVPVMLDAIPAMTPEHRSGMATHLLSSYAGVDTVQDFRSWNAARAAATSLVRAREAELRSYLLPSGAAGAANNR